LIELFTLSLFDPPIHIFSTKVRSICGRQWQVIGRPKSYRTRTLAKLTRFGRDSSVLLVVKLYRGARACHSLAAGRERLLVVNNRLHYHPLRDSSIRFTYASAPPRQWADRFFRIPDLTTLTLAHSPDPDDAFMWWPLTGKIHPDGSVMSGEAGKPRLDTEGLAFQAVPADIEVLNRRAAALGDLDITALSFRAWLDVQDRYVVTRTGSSFGEGYGPKVVGGPNVSSFDDLRRSDVRVAIPGVGTTAFLLLCLALGKHELAASELERFIPMPFDQVIGAVLREEVDAGIVIHEGQLLYQEAGLHLLIDVGEWWFQATALPTPLGCNVMRRDLDARLGKGTLSRVAALLSRSVAYALEHRDESIDYTMPFALANANKKGAEASGVPTRERVDRYVAMYVNKWTVDMGEAGIEAVRKLYGAGHAAGLCPALASFEPV